MTNLIFREVTIVSDKEKAARSVKFDPKLTVVVGQNDTGKSSLIKSLFYAFGAEPKQLHSRFKSARPIVVVTTEWAGTTTKWLRQGSTLAAFDANGSLLGRFKSVTRDCAPFFAKRHSFNLTLKDRDGQLVVPPPAFPLLPFYLDQDAGWIRPWDSFGSLGQFSDWKNDLVNYCVGLGSDEWHASRHRVQEVTNTVRYVQDRRQVFNDLTLELLEAEDGRPVLTLDVDAFKGTIDALLEQAEDLNRAEAAFRREVVELSTDRLANEEQVRLVRAAISELSADVDFASNADEEIECPTCGAEYRNSFLERFKLAQDEGRCRDFLSELEQRQGAIQDREAKARVQIESIRERSARIARLLAAQREGIELQDIIHSQGQQILLKRISDHKGGIDKRLGELDDALEKAKAAERKSRPLRDEKSRIVDDYGQTLKGFTELLHVHTLDDEVYRNLNPSIQESGSDLPRAVLAYFLTMLTLMARRSEHRAFFPMVVDSPKQQDQDGENLRRMFDLLRDVPIGGAQKIIATVDTGESKLGGTVVELTEKYHLLQQTDYEEARSRVGPLLALALSDE